MNDAGKVCMMPKGTWSASVTYEFLDVVKFAQNSWVAKQSSINQEPSENSQYWQLLAKGTTEQYGTSDTAAATAAKVATTTEGDFELSTGASVTIKFANTDTAGSCTLSVDGSTAKAIFYNGAAIEAGILTAGNAFEFVYDGTNFVMVGSAGGAKAFEVSQAEYDALPAAQKNDPNKMWFISDNDYPAVPQSATGTSFDDAEVWFTAANVQGAIEKLASMIYPIGSIYMSVNNVNPSTYFGGTWVEWGSGRVPVGVDINDSNFNTVEKSVGSNTTSYTPQGSNTAVTLTAAQSGVPTHNHGLNDHTHSIPQLSGSTNTTGKHNHSISAAATIVGSGVGCANQYGTQGTYHVDDAGDHSHTVTTDASTTGGNSGNTANNGAADASQSHNHTFTGTEANISTIQKSITCYMWKRTA